MKTIFSGCATALITPMNEHGIDYDAMEKIIERQIASGIDALLVCGTTGESATLSERERDELIAVSRSAIGGRVPLIVGTGSNNIEKAINHTKKAGTAGADAVLVVTPYYNKTTQQGLIASFSAIAEASDVPVIVYNVPSRTGMTISVETYKALAAIDKIEGIKESSADICSFSSEISQTRTELVYYCGNDNMTLPMISLGAAGVISVASNIIPTEMVRICHAALDSDFDTARNLFYEYSYLIDLLFCETNPIPIKAAMSYLGYCGDSIRLPLIGMSDGNRSVLTDELKHLQTQGKIR